jgi:hypothetical protein
MTSDDFTPKYKRRCLLPRARLAAGASVLPSAWGILTSGLQDAEVKVEPAILTATSDQNVRRVVLVCRDKGVAAASISNNFVSASRNLWSNSIPKIKLQLWRPDCCYRYKVGRSIGCEDNEQRRSLS